MARILPGSLGSTFSGVQRARELREGAVDYARAPDTPHGFDALAKTLQHPLTGMATSAISRIGDEIAYSNAVDEEKERLDKAQFEYQQAQEQAQNAARYRQQLEQEASDPNMQMAIRDAMSGPAPQVGPQVDLGHVGFAPGAGGTPGHPPMEQAMQAVGQPQPVGWRHPATGREYTREQLAAIPAEIDRLRQEEAQAAGPAPQEQFVPRTVAEFQFAIASEPDPQRRQQLLMQATRAVDAQPADIIEAIKGTAGARAQKATRGADVKAQETRHEQAVKREDLLRRRDEFDFDQRHKEARLSLDHAIASSKHEKRQSDIKHTALKMKKLERRLSAIGRRRGVPDNIKELIKKHGGFSKAATTAAFYDDLAQEASPKDFKYWQGMMLKQVKDTMGKDVAVPLALKSQLDVDKVELNRANDEIAKAESIVSQAEARLQALGPAVAHATEMTGEETFWGRKDSLPHNWWENQKAIDALKDSDNQDLSTLAHESAMKVKAAKARRGAAVTRRDKANQSYEETLKRIGTPPPAAQAPQGSEFKLVGVRD